MNAWELNAEQQLSFIKSHLDLGITTVDLAHIYGNPSCESLFGEALHHEPSMRQHLEIITKFGISLGDKNSITHYNSSQAQILTSVEASLKRLNTDYIDVLLMHRPDFLMQADEVADAFYDLKKRGLVRHFGVSNYNVTQMKLLQSRLDFPLVSNQLELNPLNLSILEDGILEEMQQNNVRPMAWSCLAGGKIFHDTSMPIQRLRNTLQEIALELGASTIDQVILAWVLKLPSNPIPILGTGNLDRIRSSITALEINMSNEQWYRIWTVSKGHPVP